MPTSLKSFNEQRREGYHKDEQEEDFLLEMNRVLQAREQALYRDYPIDHPFIFIFGPPRSGTTLISQVLASSLDCGYINNLAARFWLAPVHGIRLAKQVLKDQPGEISFQSHYASTKGLSDIHEFGYFWRHLLRKETMEDVSKSAEREADINWQLLKLTLANMQHEFQRPMVFKNIFGAYHLRKMQEILGKVLYVYIERDPLDSAISILEARKKHYEDLNNWWSYTPVEYEQIKDADYWTQIAGQVFFLQRYYRQQIASFSTENSLIIQYRDFCQSPGKVLASLTGISQRKYQYELKITTPPPAQFPFREYDQHDDIKSRFQQLFDKLAKEYDRK